MSEFIANHSHRNHNLYEFSKKLIVTGSAKEYFHIYESIINTVSANETMQIIDRLLLDDIPFEKIKENLGKLLNVFHKSLKSQAREMPPTTHFLHYMMLENRGVENIFSDIKMLLKQQKEKSDKRFDALKKLLENLQQYELHYIKKENILFPYIEKTIPHYRCLQLMWSFHDDYRNLLKQLLKQVDSQRVDLKQFNKTLGDLFFVVLPVIFREEYILYPIALQTIPKLVWNDMLLQSREIGWCYSNEPEYTKIPKEKQPDFIGDLIDLKTGILDPQQIILMLENLPVDITFVDENDEVRYFSGAKHRIFQRSKAIIGRKVQNCHPKESVHVVNEIIESFKNGSKTHADFWIQMKGLFIHIRYFALHDQSGNYRGTIEVSQDVTEIRTLKGEQRLLS
jgi:hypothetical protein